MPMVLCQECGEETLDQLATCSHCDEQLAEQATKERNRNVRQVSYGAAFVGCLGASLVASMFGSTSWAMGMGMAGLICLVLLVFNLNATR